LPLYTCRSCEKNKVESLILYFHPPAKSNVQMENMKMGEHASYMMSYNPKITVRSRYSKEASEDNQPFHKRLHE